MSQPLIQTSSGLEQKISRLDALLLQAQDATTHRRYDNLHLIKQLSTTLLKQAYLDNDPQLFAQIINKAIEFARFLHNGKAYEMAAGVFDLTAEDVFLAEKAVKKGDFNFLTWLLIDSLNFVNCVLEDSAENISKIKEIQEFKDKIYLVSKKLLQTPNLLRSGPAIIEDLKKAYVTKNTQELEYYRQEIIASLIEASLHKDVSGFANIIAAIRELAFTAHKDKRYADIIKSFEIESIDAVDLKKLFSAGKSELLYWLLLDKLNLENEVSKTKLSNADMQQFKQVVYKQLIGKTSPLTPVKILYTRMLDNLKNGNEADLTLDAIELKANLKDAFLRDDAVSYHEALEACLKIGKVAKNDNFELIAKLWDINFDAVDNTILLLNDAANHLAKFWLIEHLDLDKEGQTRNKFGAEIAEFKQQLYKIAGLSFSSSAKEILTEGLNLLKRSEKSEELEQVQVELLKLHIEAVLIYSIQQNEPALFAQLMTNIVKLAENAYKQGKIIDLLKAIDFRLDARDTFIRHLYEGDLVSAQQVLTAEALFSQSATFGKGRSFGLDDFRDHFRLDVYKNSNCQAPEITKPWQLQEYKDSSNLVTWILEQFSKGLDKDKKIKQYLSVLAKMPYLNASEAYILIDNSRNHELVNLLNDLKLAYKLGHRFGLKGKISIEDVELDLECSLIAEMLPDLQSSHEAFTKTSNYTDLVTLLQNTLNPDTSLTAEMVESINNNIKDSVRFNSLFASPEEYLQQYKAQKVVNCPVMVAMQSANIDHYMNVSFMGDLCFIANNTPGADNISGIKVFKINDKTKLVDIILKLQQSHRDKAKKLHLDTIESDLTDALKLEPFGEPVIYQAQKTGNCGWSSCAKMIVRASALGCFYQAACMQGFAEDQALNIAKTASKQYSKMFALDDRERFIIDMLDKYKAERRAIPEPIMILIAEIYAKSKNRPLRRDLVKLIEDNFTFTAKQQSAARQRITEHATLLLMKAKDWGVIDEATRRERIETLVNKYLQAGAEDKEESSIAKRVQAHSSKKWG